MQRPALSFVSAARNQLQQVLLLATNLQNGSFFVNHFLYSFHGDARALKHQRPWSKEKFMDVFNLNPIREPKRTVDVQSFNRPFDESHQPIRNYPSLLTQLLTALGPQFPSPRLALSRTCHVNSPGSLDRSTSSSTIEVVSTISKHRRSRRADLSTSDQRAPSPNSGRPVPIFESSNKQVEAGVESKNAISTQTVRRSPDGGAHVVSNSQAFQLSDGKSRTRVERCCVVADQSTSFQNGRSHGNGSRHIQSAGTTSEAITVLRNRLQRGITTNSYTYIKVLQMCSKQKDLLAAKQVHDCIIQSGMDKNKHVAVTLLNVYINCGGVLNARRVFDELEKKSVITWNAMIAGYARRDDVESAMELFKLMGQNGARPDEVTYLCILKACASPLGLTWGKYLHECIRQAGFESDVRVGTALLKMYAKCGCITEARQVFENLPNRDVIAWTLMIGGLAQNGCGHEAYRLFRQMRREGFEPDAITYLSILNASASAGDLEWVKEVHGHAIKAGLESDLRVANALLHMYAQTGSVDDARVVFDRMEKRDVVTWTVMIGGLAQHGCGREAYRMFCQMTQEGFEPNAVTYLNILKPSASAGALEWVKEVHGHASKARLESDLRVGTALVHTYAESGSIDDARVVFDRMEKRDIVTWNAMIGGLGYHGCGHEALELFREMNAEGVKPNGSSFVAVLSACCHGGLVEDGRRLFSAMTQKYGIEPDIMHYNCMVDLLGRAGYLEEAKIFISEMPIEAEVVIWKALLGACRTHGNLALGEVSAKEIFKLEPDDAAGYVLLSNIYAAAGKWENVSSVRTVMQRRGVRKEPGCSWIEVNNKVHEFIAGDTSHPEGKAIYTELNKLTEKLKAKGYIPDTRLVLHDINEEDKELALCSHSEKLAIAYGLIHIPPEEPIRVTKNLRVCPDCHTATKLISKVTGREIIARDANRFHHFKDGVCSCGDYW